MENAQYRDDDIIDLRELYSTLKKRKKLIYVFTVIITLLAAVYVFIIAKPVYEVKAMIEIGKIDAGTKTETTLDNIENVKQKLTYLYGVTSKKKSLYPRVKAISIPKKSDSIFTIIVEGRDNKSATIYIDEIVNKLENTYAQKVKTYIDTQKELILLTKNDIQVNETNLNDMKDSLKDYHKKMLNITEKDAALAGLYTIQISQNQSRLQGIQTRISGLRTKEFNLKLSIAPLRITQTHIIGNVEVLSKPIKPKKLLIIIISFITALLFAVFLTFFLEFIRGLKESNPSQEGKI